MKEETLLEILPTGEIKFRRGSKEQNKILMDILSQMVDDKKMKELKEFFEQGDEIILLEGKEILCG